MMFDMEFRQYADSNFTNGTTLMHNEWYLIAISQFGLDRYCSAGGDDNDYEYDREDDQWKLKVVGVDMI